MIKTVTWTLALSALFPAHQAWANDSSDQATVQISTAAQQALDVLNEGLGALTSKTLPHEAKDLRKQIVTLRDILDIYSHHFSEKLELWETVREELDDGYTVVGHFKDLYDTGTQIEGSSSDAEPEYKDKKELKKRREEVLEWKQDFEKNRGILARINALLDGIQPLGEGTIDNDDRFSEFFWGGVQAKPSPTATAAQNALALIAAQREIIRTEHPQVLAIEDLSTEESELLFHDHRKRIRTLVKICNLIKSFEVTTCDPTALEYAAETVSTMGEIEDLLMAGIREKSEGKKSRAKKHFERATEKFAELKLNWSSENPLAIIDRL